MRNFFTTFFTCCLLLLYIGGSAQNLDSLNALLNETIDKENEAKLHQEIASIYFQQEKIKLAEFHLLEAREIYSNDTSSLNYAKTTLSLSGIFIKQKLFGKAYRFASDAAFLAENNNYKKIRAFAIYNISIILKETGRNAEAASYAKQSILLFSELNDSLRIAYAYNNMGMIAKNLEEWDEARAYYDTSLTLKKKFGNQIDVINTLGNIAVLYKELGNYDSAYRLFEKVDVMARESGSTVILAGNFLNTAEMMVLKGDTTKALAYFDSCLNISKENNFLEMQREVYEDMAGLFYASKKYKKAWDSKDLFLAINDSILKADNALTIEQLQLIQQNHYNQSQINALKLKNTNNKILFHFAIIGLLIVVIILVYLRSVKIKKAKKDLRASEQKFRMLAENSSEVIWSSDLNLQLTYVSPSTEKILGYGREERLKKSMAEVFSPESVIKMNQELKRNLELSKKGRNEIKPIHVELSGIHKNGQEVWVEVTADFVYNEHNQPSGLQGVARNITDRKNAELKMAELVRDLNKQDQALKLQNEALIKAQLKVEETAGQYADLFENGPVGYVILDKERKIKALNSTASIMLAVNQNEILEEDFITLVEADEKNAFTTNFLETIKERKSRHQQFNLSHIATKIVFVPDLNDGMNRCRLVLIDVSAEVKVRQELSLALQSLQAVFDAIPIGIGVVDKDFKILNMNERLQKLHNIKKPSDYLSKSCFEVFKCGNQPCDSCIWNQVITTQKTIIRTSSPDDPVYKDGHYRIYSSPMFSEQGEVTGIVEVAMDISNLKKAESALAESERKFEELFNDIPDAVFITGIGNDSGRIIDVNPAAEKQTGYSRDELLQINMLAEISVGVENNLTFDREENLINNDKIKLTEQKRRKDGKHIWTEVVVQKIVIDGKPLALSVSRDISERVKIQKNLKDSEARLRSLLNALPDMLFVFDREGRYLEYHTDSYEKLILPPESFLNKKVVDVMPVELANRTMEFITKVFETGKIQLFDYSLDTPDGKNYFDARMVKASHDTALTIVRNITEARKAEQDKRQNEEKFKTLFLNSPLGVFNFDDSSVILNCNEKFEKIIGSGIDKLSGFNILSQGKDVELKKAISEAISGGSGYYEGNYKSVTSGKVIPLKAFFKSIYNDQGKFVDGIGIVEDVTEQKKHEANLIDALKRAEQSDRLKSSFMATMSHELRTPLNTVIGFADIIDDSMPIDQVLEFSGIIAKSGRHLLSIIEDVLDISLIDSGEAKMVHERFYLAELMDSLYNTASRNKITLNKDHLNIKMNLDSSIGDVKLSGDISKLNKVFNHLIKNALKFTREGEIEIGAHKENNGNNAVDILFYVKDSGIGIPADKHDIIFELFRQVDDSSTREFEGTGLGLSISKRLIQLMGGEIWLESKPGKGSTFYFQLPLLSGVTKAGAVRNKYNKPEVRNAKDINVLVAEDDDTNFHLFRLLLTRKNMNVTRARNGKEALEILSSGKEIHLVLMDINMPVLNGYDATKRIKELYNDIPVVAVTAYAMSGDKARAEEAGCDDYITKPINNIIFYETIAKYVR